MAAEAPLIVIASDTEQLVAEVSAALEQHGYAVQRAGLRGFDQLHWQRPPSLIVLDTSVPPYARADLVRGVRAAAAPSRPPIIGLASRDHLREVAAMDGVWLCLSKPLKLDNLLQAVDRITRYTADPRLTLAELVGATG